jgi:hypothetical protein
MQPVSGGLWEVHYWAVLYSVERRCWRTPEGAGRPRKRVRHGLIARCTTPEVCVDLDCLHTKPQFLKRDATGVWWASGKCMTGLCCTVLNGVAGGHRRVLVDPATVSGTGELLGALLSRYVWTLGTAHTRSRNFPNVMQPVSGGLLGSALLGCVVQC